MKIRSAKAKGRRASQRFVDALLARYDVLEEKDLYITPSSCNGVDVVFSERAKEVIGHDFAPEVKNQEKLAIWASLEQAERLAGTEQTPLLIFGRNRSDLYAALRLDHFLDVVNKREVDNGDVYSRTAG